MILDRQCGLFAKLRVKGGLVWGQVIFGNDFFLRVDLSGCVVLGAESATLSLFTCRLTAFVLRHVCVISALKYKHLIP